MLMLVVCGLIHSQTPADSTFERKFRNGTSYILKTRGGDIYTGVVTSESREFVSVENKLTLETIELRKSEIIRISRPGSRSLHDQIFGENIHARNYLFLGSAFLFEEDRATTNSHWLLLENIEYAFTENWAITLNTLAFYPITLGAKYVHKISSDAYVGATVFGIGDINSGASRSFLFGYGAQAKFTKGNSNRNFTLSCGVLGLTSDLFYTASSRLFVNTPFVSAAWCNRFSKNVALNLEGWYLPEISSGLGGLGFKFIGDEITCWTVGCYTLLNNYDNTLKLNFRTIPIPYFGVSRRFN